MPAGLCCFLLVFFRAVRLNSPGHVFRAANMPEFMILTSDGPNGPDIRAAVRQDHLDWLTAKADCKALVAGPWLDETGAMRGSLLIVEAPSRSDLDAWMAHDPYAKAGLSNTVDVRPFKLAIGRPTDS